MTVGNAGQLESPIILVNNKCFFPKDYVPQNLVRILPNSGNFTLSGSIYLQKQALDQLVKMLEAAKEEGLEGFVLVSGYRGHQVQKALFNRKLRSLSNLKGEDLFSRAAEVVAFPGSSEHQTGLAVDLSTAELNCLTDPLVAQFGETPQGEWLKQNSWKYGFILRYKEEKKQITGIIDEPWHYRYVGRPHAEIMNRNNWCLEEYLYYLRLTGKLEFKTEEGDTYLINYLPRNEYSSGESDLVPMYDGFSGYLTVSPVD